MPIDPKLIDVTFKFDGLMGDPTDEAAILDAGATNFPDEFLIPRSDRDDWIREHEKHQSSADYFSDRFTHQGNSHECVHHATNQAWLCAWNRQFGGTKHSVWLSPLASYTRATGGRQWGGSNVRAALSLMMNEGNIPSHDGPEGDLSQFRVFKHTLHETSGRSESHWPSSGWVSPRNLPDGWKDTARHFRVLEAYYIPDADAHASAVLHGWCVVNGRNGHSIPHMKIVKDGNRYLSMYRDSYRTDRYDSEKLWGGGFCVRSVAMPSDPSRPAGDDMKEAA